MVAILEMNYCSACGAPVALSIPADDNRPRHICTVCGITHYLNPKLVVASLPVWEDKVLLCRRAIEPRYGLWTLPGGFMENGESTADAAIRETREEACARIEIIDFYAMYSLRYINQVHLIFRAQLLDLDFEPGIESLEVKLFSEAHIPWNEIAFRPVKYSLAHYFSERSSGQFKVHVESLAPAI